MKVRARKRQEREKGEKHRGIAWNISMRAKPQSRDSKVWQTLDAGVRDFLRISREVAKNRGK